MAISPKGKRKITVDGRLYYWYVAPYYEDPDLIGAMLRLHIISADGELALMEPLDSCVRPDARYLTKSPVPIPDAVTPEVVRRVIEAYYASKE